LPLIVCTEVPASKDANFKNWGWPVDNFFSVLDLNHVSNLPAEKEKKSANSRIFEADEVARRSKDPKSQADQGAETPFGVRRRMFARRKRVPAEVLAGRFPGQIVISHFLFRFGKNGTRLNRFAAIVGAKFEKSSAKRHDWKRQITERLKSWPELGLDVVVSPLKEAKNLPGRKATEPIKEAFKKLI
jgi:RNase P protein component